MKKNIYLVLFVIVSIVPVFAADWKEIYPKNYIDVSSITWHKDTVSFWIKSLNPGTWKPFKNKKIWYSKDYIAVDCKEKKFAIKSSLFYDLQGGVIDSYDVNYDSILDWNRIVPDTNGDILYQAFCKY